jgi:hypothetical protein
MKTRQTKVSRKVSDWLKCTTRINFVEFGTGSYYTVLYIFITTFITQYIDVFLLKLVLDYSPSEVIKIMYFSRGLF